MKQVSRDDVDALIITTENDTHEEYARWVMIITQDFELCLFISEVTYP